MCSCFCNERYLVCLKYFGMIFSANSLGLWIRNALPLGSHDTISAVSLLTVLSNKACNLKGNAWWFTPILPSFERVEAGQSDYQKKKNVNFMKLWKVKNTGFRQNRKFLRDFLGDYLHGKLLKYRRPLLATSCARPRLAHTTAPVFLLQEFSRQILVVEWKAQFFPVYKPYPNCPPNTENHYIYAPL